MGTAVSTGGSSCRRCNCSSSAMSSEGLVSLWVTWNISGRMKFTVSELAVFVICGRHVLPACATCFSNADWQYPLQVAYPVAYTVCGESVASHYLLNFHPSQRIFEKQSKSKVRAQWTSAVMCVHLLLVSHSAHRSTPIGLNLSLCNSLIYLMTSLSCFQLVMLLITVSLSTFLSSIFILFYHTYNIHVFFILWWFCHIL